MQLCNWELHMEISVNNKTFLNQQRNITFAFIINHFYLKVKPMKLISLLNEVYS